MSDRTGFDVIIIGGGLQGCSVAIHLAQENKRVLILEKDTCGQHASGATAGGLRCLNRAVEEIPLSLAAKKMWGEIAKLVDSDCGVRPTGQIRIAGTAEDLNLLEARAERVRSLGYNHEEMIGSEELRRLVPALGSHGVGALICRGDGYGDPGLTCQAFRVKAMELGVTIHQQTKVLAIEKETEDWLVYTSGRQFKASIIVNCAGAWGGEIAAMVGDHTTLKKEALSMMVTARCPHFIDPVIGHASRKLSFKQMENGTLVIGGALRGILLEKEERTLIDWPQMQESAQTVRSVFPFLANLTIVRAWGGIEGMTPDRLPIIDIGKNASGVFHAFGFSAHGYQLAPIIGKVITDLICTGRSDFELEAFRIDRFEKAISS
ncbi:MAG: FAD-binding oxidoreductase [Desulfuromusa sp.]|nr:FAD-binding oxidoreductase [Desulfuromusa sp.]